jgi:HEAT repeat protein
MTRLATMDDAIRALKDADPDTRRRAAEWLADHGDSRAFEALVTTLHDPNETKQVRHYAAQALGRTGDPRAFPVLIGLLQDHNADVDIRSNAASALGRLGDSRALAPLVDTLKQEVDPAVRAMAAFGLGLLRDKRAVEPLIAALSDTDVLIDVRIYATAALGQLQDRRAVDPLSRILQNRATATDYEREQAARALGFIGGRDVLMILSHAAQEEASDTVRKEVMKALKRLSAQQSGE